MPLAVHADPECRGELDAQLFENPRTGLPRNLYWSLTVPCAPVAWAGEVWDCSVTCEWLTWPVRHWAELDGMGLAAVTSPALVECSLYLAEHHPVRVESLALRRIGEGARFSVGLAGGVDIQGLDELDGRDIEFSLHGEVELEGLVVIPDNLFPKPQNESEVLAALRPYADLGSFGPPVFDRFRYLLAPVAATAAGPA